LRLCDNKTPFSVGIVATVLGMLMCSPADAAAWRVDRLLRGSGDQFDRVAYDPQIAVNDKGAGVVVWRDIRTSWEGRLSDKEMIFRISTRSGKDSKWTKPRRFGLGDQLRVVALSDGRFVLLWLDRKLRVTAAVSNAKGRDWSAGHHVVDGPGVDGVSHVLSRGPNGVLTVAWYAKAKTRDSVWAATLPSGAKRLGAAQRIVNGPPGGLGQTELQVETNDAGASMALWGFSGSPVGTAYRASPSATWQAPSRLEGSEGSPQFAASLGTGPGNSFVAAWYLDESNAVSTNRGEGWAEPQVFNAGSLDWPVVTGAAGGAVVGWCTDGEVLSALTSNGFSTPIKRDKSKGCGGIESRFGALGRTVLEVFPRTECFSCKREREDSRHRSSSWIRSEWCDSRNSPPQTRPLRPMRRQHMGSEP
jgi:hypothetical protein